MDLLSSAAQQQAVVGDAVSETQHVLSKEDFLKLMLPDSPSVEEGRRKVSDLCRFEVTRNSEETPKETPGLPGPSHSYYYSHCYSTRKRSKAERGQEGRLLDRLREL